MSVKRKILVNEKIVKMGKIDAFKINTFTHASLYECHLPMETLDT